MAALEQMQGSEFSLFSERAHPSLFEVLSAHVNDGPFKSSGVEGFVRWIRQIRSEMGNLRITELVNRVSVESGYEQ